MTRELTLPELALVVLVGASGSGKSSFARAHFKPTEVLSSDFCRGLVSDDENDQAATNDAFEVLHFIARKRLAAGRLTVVDATNVQVEARKPLVALARALHCIPVAIVLDLPESVCHERNRGRADRDFGPHVIRQQCAQLRRSLRSLKQEGFRHVFILSSPEEVADVHVRRQPLWSNLRHEHGPFDIIGDVHGCYDELARLLEKLGYELTSDGDGVRCRHEGGRKAVFLGDLVDRGPKSPEVLRLVMSMVASGSALCVPGNHDIKLMRKLDGKDVKLTHGLERTMDQLATASDAFKAEIARFIDARVSHYVLDDGKLVVAHAGVKEELQGRGSGAVREFCLYGETTGETDEYGLPVRYDWAADYRGPAMVVYGHTPVPNAEWVNRTICIDTGCVFGGALTALRYPEKELVQVDADQVHYEPKRPLHGARPAAARAGELLDIEDVRGKRIIQTRVHHTVTVREENAVPALEIMSRFAIDPRWLIYLPPTMSPSETVKEGPFLEHPREALAYFRDQGVARVVCEEKHMGSRAVVVVCRSAQAAKERFRVDDGRSGVCFTRTGRPFFGDQALERAFVERVAGAMDKSGLWSELGTDWACLDAELMPWSAKAQELVRDPYAAVGAAGTASLRAVDAALSKLEGLEGATALRERFQDRARSLDAYRAAYRRYCWPVRGLDDHRLAPFHLLASEGAVHTGRDHQWHMDTLARLAAVDPLFVATPYTLVDLADDASAARAIAWWEERTARGGEGMVIKPLDWIVRGKKGLVQPAIKCRGREYLRIIYGPDYLAPENLERLRARGLGMKRALALREFTLGLEALYRFVEREPLHRVHECVFGVLALESEPVDPRL